MMMKPWKIKFSDIHLLATLVAGLNRFHRDFGVFIIDGVLEEIRVGLEVLSSSSTFYTFFS